MSVKRALGAALGAALLAALPAVPASANVQVGSSGWQWGNPLPQGNTVRATSFAGATGYAAGDFGTLLKTNDGGTTWSGLPVGTFEGLSVVQALDADTVFAGGGCVARRSTDGGRSFSSVRFTAVESSCRTRLRDLSFVSRDAGYLLLEDGSVFATSDGGAQFAPRTAVPDTPAAGGPASARAISFLDADLGFAASGGKVFRTVNGGRSWAIVASAGPQINRLWFSGREQGFAVGDGGLVLRSDDGGATWIPRTTPPNAPSLTSIRCNSSAVCILTTATGRELIRVTDAGNAQPVVLAASTDPLHAAAFASPQRVVAAGANGATVVSDDAGETFRAIGGRLDGTFAGLRVGGAAGSAYAPGASGRIARTIDGGRSWSTDGNVPTSADLVDVSFPTVDDGYALDADGGLFHTASGGRAWEPLGTGSTRQPRALLAPDPSSVLVVGPRGIRRSVDAGETFDQVRASAVLRAQLDGATAARAGGAVFAWGPTTLVRSSDRGARWTALQRPRGVRIVQVAFANPRVGLLLDARDRVWRTADAGRRWTRLLAVGTEDVRGIAIRSPRTATLVTGGFGHKPGGYLLRSADAGATWQPQFVVDELIGSRGLAGGDGVDYLLAGGTGLLFSTTGGVAGDPSELTVITKRRRPAKPGRITVTGRLRPASGGAQVVVSMLAPGARRWSHQTASVAANGTFATAWRVPRGSSTFVAQWTGDFASAGAGSRPLTVTVVPRAHPQPRRR